MYRSEGEFYCLKVLCVLRASCTVELHILCMHCFKVLSIRVQCGLCLCVCVFMCVHACVSVSVCMCVCVCDCV